MGDRHRALSFDELPSYLLLEIMCSGKLSAIDLICLEFTSKAFGATNGLCPSKFNSLVDYAAFQLCGSHAIFCKMSLNSQKELYDRCGGKWKRVLRFLQSVEQASGVVETPSGSMQITTGKYHTLAISNSSVYSCGSSLCGALGQGSETTQLPALAQIDFPPLARVAHVSASYNHAAFVMQSGEVFTCGDNSYFCCGHRDTNRAIFRPRLVESLTGIPCKQVSTGLNFTVFLTRQGHVYTCGNNSHGQLGLGDTQDRPIAKMVEVLANIGPVVQVAAGSNYILSVTEDGSVYSFGSGSNFCLGHGSQHDELFPRCIQKFRRKGIHVVRVSAGDEHATALDSNGIVYTWGKGYCGALGHGDEIEKTRPEILSSLKNHVAVQVCARKRKTFILLESGLVYAFGSMGFGSLGFLDRRVNDKILKPRLLTTLRSFHVSQISTGLYHTVVVTNHGQIFGFGDNERAQLGHDSLRECTEPTEIFIEKSNEDYDSIY
ncbi:uncharacterized protein LOC127086369 isoform X1 [Lathyrus oleraceus]|uniref:RCC1-like domain-containing protein n=2 Tax=Pisum sativum TaxID=3888 RepID=A0A9D4X220_PEA|nr:uncharacterized protein LOC127086369 isoform X1 [Pisum sativum]KAI5411947.1 hypothetical protein KIW84_056857 [Pisum sativum]